LEEKKNAVSVALAFTCSPLELLLPQKEIKKSNNFNHKGARKG
jgi:hypothetical protein